MISREERAALRERANDPRACSDWEIAMSIIAMVPDVLDELEFSEQRVAGLTDTLSETAVDLTDRISELTTLYVASRRETAALQTLAENKELDRAVQSEIARAFGELVWLSLHHHGAYVNQCIEIIAGILHPAMGGRIPDEVP